MFGPIEIDNPEIQDAAVGRDVPGLADIDDALAVGRNLRVGGDLDVENSHRLEAVGDFLSGDSESRKQEEDG
jgi:hypothetical protein